ncbi:TPA: hypothetical protein QDA88_001689 [Burkholderia vietnamiensis]|nr:hypothetical protein [Burkholderia vietnamiensis]
MSKKKSTFFASKGEKGGRYVWSEKIYNNSTWMLVVPPGWDMGELYPGTCRPDR